MVCVDMLQLFYIEGVFFLICNVNGVMLFLEDRGWKDIVWVDG